MHARFQFVLFNIAEVDMRIFIFLLCFFVTSPGFSATIEGSAAENVVENGTILGSGLADSRAVWQLLIKYRRDLYSCLVVFKSDGMEVRQCWTE